MIFSPEAQSDAARERMSAMSGPVWSVRELTGLSTLVSKEYTNAKSDPINLC